MSKRETKTIPVDKEVIKSLEKIRKEFIKQFGVDCGWRGAEILLDEKASRSQILKPKEAMEILVRRGVNFRKVEKEIK